MARSGEVPPEPASPQVVVILKDEYDKLVAINSRLETLERAVDTEKALRGMDTRTLYEHIEKEACSRPMKDCVAAVREDFRLNNYAPRLWASFNIVNPKNGKLLSKFSKSYLKHALEATGDFVFEADSRDSRRLIIKFIGRSCIK